MVDVCSVSQQLLYDINVFSAEQFCVALSVLVVHIGTVPDQLFRHCDVLSIEKWRSQTFDCQLCVSATLKQQRCDVKTSLPNRFDQRR